MTKQELHPLADIALLLRQGTLTRVKHDHPPLVEALCELKFVSAAATPWDWTVAGLLYERIKERFPRRKEARRVDVSVGPALTAQPNERVQFRPTSGEMIVQVGRDLLAVNSLAPHVGWESLRDTTLWVLEQYKEIATPMGIAMCAVRYVNQVDIPLTTEFALEAYFQVLPAMPSSMPGHVAAFMTQTEALFDDPAALLKFRFGTTIGPAEHASFIVDLEHVVIADAVPKFEALPQWLDAGHQRVTEAFLATFTEKTQDEIFGTQAHD